ncbi:MAG: carboxypeptidase-like regulatory domain-containing protein [bacterium]
MHRGTTALHLILIVVFASAAGCSDPASAPSGDLALQVLGVSEAPVSGITVSLEPGDHERTTGEDGWAIFEEIAVGEYQVRLAGDLYETATATFTVEDGTRAEHTVQLTGRPGSLLITTWLNSLPHNGVTVRVIDPDDQSELFSEEIVSSGRVTAEGLPAGWVEVRMDTSANLCAGTAEAEVLPLETVEAPLTVAPFASLLHGSAEFGNSDSHEVIRYEVYNSGSSIRYLGDPVPFTGSFDLLSTVHGHLGAAILGNPVPTEMGIMWSPDHDANTSFVTVNLPSADGRVSDAAPADDQAFLTTDLPITMSITYPTSGCVGTIWEAYYWWYENDQWNWTTAYTSGVLSVQSSHNWDGSYSASSDLAGQTLIAAPEGSWYSWAMIAGYQSGYTSMTWDYFFTLAEPSAGAARRAAAPARIGPDAETMREAILLRARTANEKMFPIPR